MALFDGAGQADGIATATASGSIFGAFGGATVGAASGSGTVTGNVGGAAVAAGAASNSAAANIEGVLEGTAAGAAVVFAETHPFGAGTAVGVGTLSSAAGAHVLGGAGVAAGAAIMTGSAGVLYLSTGIANGSGELLWDYIVDGAGTVVGTSSMVGSGNRIITAKGITRGSTLMVWSFPLPMVGKTIMAAHVEVARVVPLNAVTAPAKCFRYLQLLQRGDCSICISDINGPVSPHSVRYTLYQKRPNGTRFQVGPAARVPATGIVGEYYITGRAGECGQPGEWVIRWEYQKYFQGPCEVVEQCFQVVDAVGAADPRDIMVRITKFGWN